MYAEVTASINRRIGLRAAFGPKTLGGVLRAFVTDQ
jgi:hypothetical protein